MQLPSKHECCYILEMLESGLIDYTYTHPWSEHILSAEDCVPQWLLDIYTKKNQGDQTKALREYICSEPFELGPSDLEKFHLGCLWIRYERHEISWAMFLSLAGDHLDSACGDWDCETPFHYLTVFKDAYFSPESEEQTKAGYLADHNLRPWIEMAWIKFEPFRKMKKNRSR
jgi:hypothetical protein